MGAGARARGVRGRRGRPTQRGAHLAAAAGCARRQRCRCRGGGAAKFASKNAIRAGGAPPRSRTADCTQVQGCASRSWTGGPGACSHTAPPCSGTAAPPSGTERSGRCAQKLEVARARKRSVTRTPSQKGLSRCQMRCGGQGRVLPLAAGQQTALSGAPLTGKHWSARRWPGRESGRCEQTPAQPVRPQWQQRHLARRLGLRTTQRKSIVFRVAWPSLRKAALGAATCSQSSRPNQPASSWSPVARSAACPGRSPPPRLLMVGYHGTPENPAVTSTPRPGRGAVGARRLHNPSPGR